MIEFGHILLVRHGDYDTQPDEQLSAGGKEDSWAAREELIRRGIGSGAVLLSSTAPRALQTASIIGEGLSADVMPSKRIEIIGNYPEGITSFDEELAMALAEADAATAGGALVVVTHAPLISHVAQTPVGYGEIYPYELGTWDNPKYLAFKGRKLQADLVNAGLDPRVTP